MNISFVGGFFPKEKEKEILNNSKRQVQNASNTFQWAFINGLEYNLGKPIKLITASFIGYFPFYYSKLYFNSFSFSHKEGASDKNLGFLNLPLVKNIFKYFAIKNAVNEFVVNNKDDHIVILYSLELAYLKAIAKVKETKPNLKICLIITDLPNYPGDSGFLYRKYIQLFEKNNVYKLLKYVDYFVVLTEAMVEFLKINNKPWVRIEGLYEPSESFEVETPISSQKKVILYSGTISLRYGIKNLLDAFTLIKSKDYELWLCGGFEGEAQKLVQSRLLEDERIKYLGLVKRENVIQLQKSATLLVNPRNSKGSFNKYSFPSKTMEYFASGTPTLMYKLEGIPPEYFNYCYTLTDESIEKYSETIFNICEQKQEDLKEKGRNAKEFILKNKNYIVQSNKVISMLIS
jgi:glycosyltransferase involved in cell wall biosynthesis